MKCSTALGVSLALNVILAGAFVVMAGRSSTSEAPSFLSRPATASGLVATRPVPPAPDQFAEESGGRTWLQRLRDAGVPGDVLSGVLAADFEKHWERKRREMERRYKRGELDDDWLARFEQQHDEEQEKEMRTTLGEEIFRAWDKENTLRDYDLDALKMSLAETEALYELRKNLSRKQHEVELARENGKLDNADYAAQQDSLQKEYDHQFKTLLGEERYAATQNPVDEMRRSLKNLNVSDAQFTAMLDTQRKWNELRTELDQEMQRGKSSEKELQALDAARDAEYQRVLGAGAFDELKKNQDSSYQTLKQNAALWKLTERDIDYVYNALQYSQKAVSDYQKQARISEEQGQPVNWDNVRENIQKFSDQTQSALRIYLGDDRFNKLKRNELFNSGEK